tara:strand:+ start:301 stop:3120 length:2820 start_codon:yes stop_codon:yes gene_type:complete
MSKINPHDSRGGTNLSPGDSILDSIARRTGRAQSVNLDDAGTGGEAPIIDPKAHELQKELSATDQGKYRILGEIARGGMGVVLRGHDVELGRDIAIKVTDAELAKRPEVLERFIEEAQIGGQLQHPGIVPVYELGLMADQRPFFTMKLIKGRTLAAMLSRRKTVEEDRVRFLQIWESVCQTMAYAHSKGVIHRDLKPANIMVGAFGEVQVVDWGLSKVLRRGGVADEIEARDTAMSVIETVRSGPGSDSGSMVGSILGTPAYMSPEQAKGEPDKLDERTDVFALGALLCEILTGSPPYVAEEGKNLVQMAAFAELDDARARIEASNAPKDLIRLCLASLMTARAARPRDAEELATAVHAHLAGLETRAHEAQLSAAEDRLRAERSRRRLQLTLLVAVVLVLAGGGWWFVETNRRQRVEELSTSFASVQDDVVGLQRAGDFASSVEVARGGLRLVSAGDASSELVQRAEQLVASAEGELEAEQERLAQLAREQSLFNFLLDVEMRQVRTGFDETDEELDAEYSAEFLAYGLDLEAEDLGDRLVELRDTDLGIRLALGFDGWARLLRRMGAERDFKLELMTGVGIDLDTDPLRTTVRWALVERDGDQLLALSKDLDIDSTPPETLALLASGLSERNELEAARSLYVSGANRYPDSFLLNYGAGRLLYWMDRRAESDVFEGALGYLQAALALRPEQIGLRVLIGDVYMARGHAIMAEHHLSRALAVSPTHAWNHEVIGLIKMQCGRFEESLEWFELAIEANPASSWPQSAARACQVALGQLTIDDYLAWGVAQKRQDEWAILGPAMALTFPGFTRTEPDPERARALLEPHLVDRLEHGITDAVFCNSLCWVGLALGDLPLAIEAIELGREYDEGEVNRRNIVQALLADSAVARLRGDATTARVLLEKARRLRDELMAGMEDEWRNTSFLINFEYCERIATGG